MSEQNHFLATSESAERLDQTISNHMWKLQFWLILKTDGAFLWPYVPHIFVYIYTCIPLYVGSWNARISINESVKQMFWRNITHILNAKKYALLVCISKRNRASQSMEDIGLKSPLIYTLSTLHRRFKTGKQQNWGWVCGLSFQKAISMECRPFLF